MDLSIYLYRQDNIDNDELSFLGTRWNTHVLLYRKGRLLILGKFKYGRVTASFKIYPARVLLTSQESILEYESNKWNKKLS